MKKTIEKKEFGIYGGAYVPDILKSNLKELENEFLKAIIDNNFEKELKSHQKNYIGRPSSLFLAKNLSKIVGSKIYLKREDLNHTGAHKINNTMGQILLAKKMNKKEIIAETGAGQHGVATATAAALFDIKCKIFMGKIDAQRQKMNVDRIKMLGAELIEVTTGTQTLKDAVDGALKYYIENPESYYLLGSTVGPHPYPTIVRYFQSVIGRETKKQILEREGRLPDSIYACVGGGSNAIGIFSGFLNDKEVALYGAEGGGKGLKTNKNAATLSIGNPAVFQGTYSYCLTDKNGNPREAYSISAGLDYPGIGPEHSHLKDIKRVKYKAVTDREAIGAFKLLSEKEGIIPAIESAHALYYAVKNEKNKNNLVIINLSGRGDKDVGRNFLE